MTLVHPSGEQRIRVLAEREIAALAAALPPTPPDAGPDPAPGGPAECLRLARGLNAAIDSGAFSHSVSARVSRRIAAVVLARAGQAALAPGGPPADTLYFCVLDPLHGLLTVPDPPPRGPRRRERTEVLCDACRERVTARPPDDFWSEALHTTQMHRPPLPYHGGAPFSAPEHGVARVLKDARTLVAVDEEFGSR
ncbi:hypothetical protein [Streptomyces avicenniae]|uniref:hypothetical protein n=1 Tax=Streptomyces avicenniae TaxID=500153 RepID=UPI000A3E2665|nr:hypothetical protein [Streptomyces avicenniae]